MLCAGRPVRRTDKKGQGTQPLAWVDMTFCLRINFDEFLELRLPARGCLNVNDTVNDDRAFLFDHIDLFRGQLLQVCKVDLGNELLKGISQESCRTCQSQLTLGPAWAISAVRVASSLRMSFQDAVRRSCVVAETSLLFKSRKLEGRSDMMNSSGQFSLGSEERAYSASCSHTPPSSQGPGVRHHFRITPRTDDYDYAEDSLDGIRCVSYLLSGFFALN